MRPAGRKRPVNRASLACAGMNSQFIGLLANTLSVSLTAPESEPIPPCAKRRASLAIHSDRPTRTAGQKHYI